MKKLIGGLFKLFMLVCSVLIGFMLVRKFKSKDFLMEDNDFDIENDGEIDEFTEEDIIEEAKPIKLVKPIQLITKKTPLEKKLPVKQYHSDTRLSARQREVLSIIEKDNIVEMKVLQKKIKGVTERTLRRDLTQLQTIGAIKKIGNTKSVKYQLINK